jgi:hypothetical protein
LLKKSPIDVAEEASGSLPLITPVTSIDLNSTALFPEDPFTSRSAASLKNKREYEGFRFDEDHPMKLSFPEPVKDFSLDVVNVEIPALESFKTPRNADGSRLTLSREALAAQEYFKEHSKKASEEKGEHLKSAYASWHPHRKREEHKTLVQGQKKAEQNRQRARMEAEAKRRKEKEERAAALEPQGKPPKGGKLGSKGKGDRREKKSSGDFTSKKKHRGVAENYNYRLKPVADHPVFLTPGIFDAASEFVKEAKDLGLYINDEGQMVRGKRDDTKRKPIALDKNEAFEILEANLKKS